MWLVNRWRTISSLTYSTEDFWNRALLLVFYVPFAQFLKGLILPWFIWSLHDCFIAKTLHQFSLFLRCGCGPAERKSRCSSLRCSLPARYCSILAITPYEVAHWTLLGQLLRYMATDSWWPPPNIFHKASATSKLFILEGSNSGQCDSITEIITIKSNLIAFGIALEVLKGRRNNFEHFWWRLEV